MTIPGFPIVRKTFGSRRGYDKSPYAVVCCARKIAIEARTLRIVSWLARYPEPLLLDREIARLPLSS